MNVNTFIHINELFRETSIRAGCVRILPDEKLFFIYNFVIWFANYCFEIFNTGGGLYFCLKKDFIAINGFDEKIYAAEDLDFAGRIKKQVKSQGFKFKSCADIPIKTSMRKLYFFGWKKAIPLIIRFFMNRKKMMKIRKDWEELFYNTDKLR